MASSARPTYSVLSPWSSRKGTFKMEEETLQSFEAVKQSVQTRVRWMDDKHCHSKTVHKWVRDLKRMGLYPQDSRFIKPSYSYSRLQKEWHRDDHLSEFSGKKSLSKRKDVFQLIFLLCVWLRKKYIFLIHIFLYIAHYLNPLVLLHCYYDA